MNDSMTLPKDSNGKPIHVGDTARVLSSDERVKVIAVDCEAAWHFVAGEMVRTRGEHLSVCLRTRRDVMRMALEDVQYICASEGDRELVLGEYMEMLKEAEGWQ